MNPLSARRQVTGSTRGDDRKVLDGESHILLRSVKTTLVDNFNRESPNLQLYAICDPIISMVLSSFEEQRQGLGLKIVNSIEKLIATKKNCASGNISEVTSLWLCW